MTRLTVMAIVSIAVLQAVPAVAGPGDFHYVRVLQAEVRESPSADSELKFIIAVGRKLVEFDRQNEWIHVGVDKAGGRDGWVELSKVSDTDPDGLRY